MNDAYEHEDASNLEFGKALTGQSPVLFNAEVAVLLDNRRKEYQDKGLRVPEALTLTLEYCKTFGGVKPADEEGANQYLANLRQVLEQWEFGGAEDTPYKKSLHPFEVAALANLMTTSSDRDEACALIPSLRRTDRLGDRFTEDQIDAILENFQNVLLGLQQGQGSFAGGGGAATGEEKMVTGMYQEHDDL